MFNWLTRQKYLKHSYKTQNGLESQFFYRDKTSDWNTIQAAFEEDEYNLESLKLKPNELAVDIGSHIGGVSILLAKMGLKVIGVEALPENATLQKKNIQLNHLQNQIQLINNAISGEDDRKTVLYYGDRNEESGLHHEFIGSRGDFKTFFGKGKSIEIKTISIDGIFKTFNIKKCRLLKIDVEGAEWDAFSTVSEATWNKIDIVLGEWHTYKQYSSRQQLFAMLPKQFKDISIEMKVPDNDFIFKRIDSD